MGRLGGTLRRLFGPVPRYRSGNRAATPAGALPGPAFGPADNIRLKVALLGIELYRCLHHDAAIEVATPAAPHRLDAFFAQPEHLARLGFGRDLQRHLPLERRNEHGAAKYGGCKAHGNLA